MSGVKGGGRRSEWCVEMVRGRRGEWFCGRGVSGVNGGGRRGEWC